MKMRKKERKKEIEADRQTSRHSIEGDRVYQQLSYSWQAAKMKVALTHPRQRV